MIVTQKATPEVYYKRSRDFQAIGRVFDVVFNYLKTASDQLDNITVNELIDVKLLDLVATTLGFKKSHEYNSKELLAFCCSFSAILKCKGTKKSIEDILKAIAGAQNIVGNIHLVYDPDLFRVNIFVPETFTELALFEDVLDYILPAGVSYRVIKETQITGAYTDLYFENSTSQKSIKHKMLQGQLLQSQMALPMNADTGISRMDNIAIIPALDNPEDISNIVKEVIEENDD